VLDGFPQLKRIINNPSAAELRQMARHDEVTTEYGSPAYQSRVRSRSAKFTKNSIDTPFTDADRQTIQRVLDTIKRRETHEVLVLDRQMGRDPELRRHCRLMISADYARIALGWSEMLKPASPDEEPDLLTIFLPEWEELRILVDPPHKTTYVLGTDYIGEAKKSFLRMWMYEAKQAGGLGLHAGSKRARVRAENGKLREVTQLFFGLSATGKSTLTTHRLGLMGKEGAELFQDDVVGWMPDGRCLGSEGKGLYIKTEGLTPESQPDLYQAAVQPTAIFENVWVDPKTGKVDFENPELTGNGRATVQRADLPGAAPQIDLSEVNELFFITRTPLVPPIAKLTPVQAAVAFMLGESVESSAGDPTRAGERVRVVGTNPFIIGPLAEEGNRLLAMLRANPRIECYLLNTGRAGEGERSQDITVATTVAILRAVARDQICWQEDPELGFQISASVPGLDMEAFDPRRAYTQQEFRNQLAKLRAERRGWLTRFKGLNPEILSAIY
jgi:phosphoenolpyruvate carboxykinase (ATP)